MNLTWSQIPQSLHSLVESYVLLIFPELVLQDNILQESGNNLLIFINERESVLT